MGPDDLGEPSFDEKTEDEMEELEPAEEEALAEVGVRTGMRSGEDIVVDLTMVD